MPRIKRQARTRVVVTCLFIGLASNSLVSAAEASYYVSKTTWQESLYASLEVFERAEAAYIAKRAERLDKLGVKLGPWYSAGPFFTKSENPFDVVFGPEADTDLKKTYGEPRLRWVERPQWKDGRVHDLPGADSLVANYLLRTITLPHDAKLPVYLGSNDGLAVWFNDEKVLARNVGRRAAPDQDVLELNFKKGTNKLVLKVNNRASAHGFYFSMSPAGPARGKTLAQLWELLQPDFKDPTSRQQMQWEREDKIWDNDSEPVTLRGLAAAYTGACKVRSLALKSRKIAGKVGTQEQLQKIREVYYLSRRYDKLITHARENVQMMTRATARVRRKVELLLGELDHLNGKYDKTAPRWRNYRAVLLSLEELTAEILASAARGQPGAMERLARAESELENVYTPMKLDLEKLHRVSGSSETSKLYGRKCQPFDLNQVRLLDGPFKRAMELDKQYLYDLDSDRLLHMFRVTSGLASSAKQLGGWEKEGVRGQTMGHYLTACALMYASTGDEQLKAKADAIVSELAKCQNANGNGYLSAYPESGITGVIYGTSGWWAPWYTLHKIYAGLVDMYVHCDNKQALGIAEEMAAWAKGHLDKLTYEQTQRMLDVEYGGMSEALCNLYAVTQNPDHLDLAQRFDHKKIIDPLADFEDRLRGLHTNTTIPKIIGAAREYELTGRRYYYNIATYFWDEVVDARSYCTGGTSNGERWHGRPYELADQLSPHTQESCCTYNMLKLTRLMFCWDPAARYADYYERALFNGILATQNPDDGMMMYFVPLAPGYWKCYNSPYDSFWCCTGTGLENHAKYGESIYFHDDDGIFVNLFIASELTWSERGIRLVQQTTFPEQAGTSLTVRTEKPVELAIRVRIPEWAKQGVTASINGRKQKTDTVLSGFLTLKRKWKDGDTVTLNMPMSLYLYPMPDDPTLAAIMYGPLVLAGQLDREGLTREMTYGRQSCMRKSPHEINFPPLPAPVFTADVDDLDSWIKPVPGQGLTFRTVNAGDTTDVTLIPFHKLFGRRYGIYWRIYDKKN